MREEAESVDDPITITMANATPTARLAHLRLAVGAPGAALLGADVACSKAKSRTAARGKVGTASRRRRLARSRWWGYQAAAAFSDTRCALTRRSELDGAAEGVAGERASVMSQFRDEALQAGPSLTRLTTPAAPGAGAGLRPCYASYRVCCLGCALRFRAMSTGALPVRTPKEDVGLPSKSRDHLPPPVARAAAPQRAPLATRSVPSCPKLQGSDPTATSGPCAPWHSIDRAPGIWVQKRHKPAPSSKRTLAYPATYQPLAPALLLAGAALRMLACFVSYKPRM